MKSNRCVSKNLRNGGKPWILAGRLVRDSNVDSVVAFWKLKMNGISDSMGGDADQGVNHMLHANALPNELLTVDTV